MDMPKYPRTPPRLGRIFPHDPLYFVTCCTQERRSILANDRVHAAFVEFAARAQTTHNVAVGRYVIMPDHIHFFVAGDPNFKLGAWVGTLKRIVAERVTSRQPAAPVWQRGFFDHVLRSSESYSEKWNYVRDNPVRAGLVKKADDWPYAGEVVPIYFD
jgi:putative transposase